MEEHANVKPHGTHSCRCRSANQTVEESSVAFSPRDDEESLDRFGYKLQFREPLARVNMC